MYANLLKHF